MQKKLIALLAAAALIVALAAGCGPNGSTTTPTDTPSTMPTDSGGDVTDPPAAGDNDPAVTIRLAHDYAPESANFIGMESFKKMVEEKSGGSITIEIFGNGELSGRNSQTTFKLLQSGDIDMAIVPPPNTDAWQLYYLPFFFRNQDVALAASEGEGGQKMLALLRDSNNVEGLSFIPIAMRAFTNSQHPIETPEDMAGLSFRVLDVPTLVSFMKAFGASATPMAMNELYMALQNHTVDGQENPLDTIRNQAFYEVQQYLSITDHIWSFSIFAANADFWDTKLTENQQNILRECAIEASREIKELAPKVDQEAYDYLVNEAKMQINTLTDEQWLEFQKVSKQVWKEMEPTIGSDILEAYMKDLGLTWD